MLVLDGDLNSVLLICHLAMVDLPNQHHVLVPSELNPGRGIRFPH